MPKHRTKNRRKHYGTRHRNRRSRHSRRSRRRRQSGILSAFKKGLGNVNKFARPIARGISKYPVAGVEDATGMFLRPRMGGFSSAAVRQLRNPGVFAATPKPTKGGRKRRRRGGKYHTHKKRHGGNHCHTHKKRR